MLQVIRCSNMHKCEIDSFMLYFLTVKKLKHNGFFHINKTLLPAKLFYFLFMGSEYKFIFEEFIYFVAMLIWPPFLSERKTWLWFAYKIVVLRFDA